jgi:hypothetical protein
MTRTLKGGQPKEHLVFFEQVKKTFSFDHWISK